MAKIDHAIDNHNSKYHRYIEKSYFHVCAGKSTLEIGPSKGTQTPCIINNNPSVLTLVEADTNACQDLITQFTTADTINQDIFKYYRKPHKMDVVVCCGVLYHLHSPFQLLELIIKQSDPEYLVLDCVDTDSAAGWFSNEINVFEGHPLFKGKGPDDYTTVYRNSTIYAVTIDQEPINNPGMRQVNQEKNISFSVIFPTELYKTALASMGYQIVKFEKLGRKFKTKGKSNSWMGLWKKI